MFFSFSKKNVNDDILCKGMVKWHDRCRSSEGASHCCMRRSAMLTGWRTSTTGSSMPSTLASGATSSGLETTLSSSLDGRRDQGLQTPSGSCKSSQNFITSVQIWIKKHKLYPNQQRPNLCDDDVYLLYQTSSQSAIETSHGCIFWSWMQCFSTNKYHGQS